MMRLCTRKSMSRRVLMPMEQSSHLQQEPGGENVKRNCVHGGHENENENVVDDYKKLYRPLDQLHPLGSSEKHTHLCLILIFVFAISSLILSTTASGHDTLSGHAHCIRTANNGNNQNQTINSTLKCVISYMGQRNLTISRSILEEFARKHELSFKTGNPRKDKIHTLDVTCSPRLLNQTRDSVVNFTELSDFLPTLETIAITGCNLTKDGLEGSLTKRLRRLNLSNNKISSLPDKLFIPKGHHQLALSSINLSNNENLNSLPKTLLDLDSVQKVWLSRHNMTCQWVAANLFKWFEKKVLMDADKSDCRSVEISIRLTTYGALRVKQDEMMECNRTLANCSCGIYTVQYTDTLKRTNFAVSFQSHGENVSITLQVDCSFLNLTRLPQISPLTRFLNVSHNRITHIDELHNDEYKNLGTLVAEYNQIENIDSVVNTNFVGQFDVFGLSHNNISSLSHQLMSDLLDIEVKGHGRISLGENYINCDCDTARFLKLLLAKHQKRIADAKQLFCRNWKVQVKVQELEFTKVCKPDQESEDNVTWHVIIVVEVLLIIMILFKVWHDHRQYRQTGILPFFSIKMPRLPCDF